MESRLLQIAEWVASYRRMADVGAGPGHLSRWLRSRGHRVVATDLSPHVVASL